MSKRKQPDSEQKTKTSTKKNRPSMTSASVKQVKKKHPVKIVPKQVVDEDAKSDVVEESKGEEITAAIRQAMKRRTSRMR